MRVAADPWRKSPLPRQHPARLQEIVGDEVLELEPDEQQKKQSDHRSPSLQGDAGPDAAPGSHAWQAKARGRQAQRLNEVLSLALLFSERSGAAWQQSRVGRLHGDLRCVSFLAAAAALCRLTTAVPLRRAPPARRWASILPPASRPGSGAKVLVVGADIFIGDTLVTDRRAAWCRSGSPTAPNWSLAPNSRLVIEDYLLREDGSAGKLPSMRWPAPSASSPAAPPRTAT